MMVCEGVSAGLCSCYNVLTMMVCEEVSAGLCSCYNVLTMMVYEGVSAGREAAVEESGILTCIPSLSCV